MNAPRLLGLSASARNPWPGPGQSTLTESVLALPHQDDLMDYIRVQGELCLEKYLEAGRKEGKNFADIYTNLRKMTKRAGLSNSELALSAALWSAAQRGAEIRHVPLSAHFPPEGGVKAPDLLRDNLLWADGLLIAGPVYFGDRSSLVKSLQDFILGDENLRESMRGKLYGGISVGAKRNGGQETTLIYQLVDMLDMGMLGVGNDSDTTAQYGGTCHAGDVGTIHADKYGLDTSMGVGRRMAQTLTLLASARRLKDRPKALALLLQDSDGLAKKQAEAWAAELAPALDIQILDLSGEQIRRCMACDICPMEVGTDETYRCMVKSDAMKALHGEMLDYDMLIPIVVSTKDPRRLQGDYQKFMERTRYLRRSDYIWSDTLVVPVALQEAGAVSTYNIRMLTSLIRHHTVMFRPLVGQIVRGEILNPKDIGAGLEEAATDAARLAAGRLARALDGGVVGYNPVGYVLSADKGKDDSVIDRRVEAVKARVERLSRQAAQRLHPKDGDV
jgi:multimeric flavodoxin WrbA